MAPTARKRAGAQYERIRAAGLPKERRVCAPPRDLISTRAASVVQTQRWIPVTPNIIVLVRASATSRFLRLTVRSFPKLFLSASDAAFRPDCAGGDAVPDPERDNARTTACGDAAFRPTHIYV